MARNKGCCRRAKSALTRDCSPVRLPNCVEGYLLGQRDLSQTVPSQAPQIPHWLGSGMLVTGAAPLVPVRRGRTSLRIVGCRPLNFRL